MMFFVDSWVSLQSDPDLMQFGLSSRLSASVQHEGPGSLTLLFVIAQVVTSAYQIMLVGFIYSTRVSVTRLFCEKVRLYVPSSAKAPSLSLRTS